MDKAEIAYTKLLLILIGITALLLLIAWYAVLRHTGNDLVSSISNFHFMV